MRPYSYWSLSYGDRMRINASGNQRMTANNDAAYWRKAYETLVKQTGRDLNDGYGLDSRKSQRTMR